MTTTYQHAPTLARTLILDELSALSLYKARRGTDPPQNGPFAKRPELLTVLFSGAIQELCRRE
jgi:formylmethanofuran dehydrogenase subunit A